MLCNEKFSILFALYLCKHSVEIEGPLHLAFNTGNALQSHFHVLVCTTMESLSNSIAFKSQESIHLFFRLWRSEKFEKAINPLNVSLNLNLYKITAEEIMKLNLFQHQVDSLTATRKHQFFKKGFWAFVLFCSCQKKLHLHSDEKRAMELANLEKNLTRGKLVYWEEVVGTVYWKTVS